MLNSNLEIIRQWERILAEKCSSWIEENKEEVFLVDPIDGKEISAHYGATHTAIALMIFGQRNDDDSMYCLGRKLLSSILNRWDYCSALQDFHFDFNNFALCIIEDLLPEDDSLVERIKSVVLKTPDSNHDTINWLPMRAFVNKKRHEWTGLQKYLDAMNCCLSKVMKATNDDGGVEDRLPKGSSFNLQYDIATVCCLQFLCVHGVEKDLSRELGFLLNAVAPDGDINYQGRGANQVFAWSCWIYLLSSSGRETDLMQALRFLDGKLEKMLSHNNLLLNNEPGCEKRLWWDYHHASVYISHLFLWLVLAEIDYGRRSIEPVIVCDGSTGLDIYNAKDFFVAVFNGRREYLAERGPVITAVWTKKEGMVFKGSFGPWQGLFGNDYCSEESVLYNYWGPLEVHQNIDWHRNRWIRKFLANRPIIAKITSKPRFSAIEVKSESADCIDIIFTVPSHCCINLPVFNSSHYTPKVYEDGNEVSVSKPLLIVNQYGELSVYRTKPSDRKTVNVRIRK